MISNALILSFGVSLVCTLILPVVLLIVLLITRKLNPLPLLAGFASFFISQILLRIPLLQVLGTQSWFAAFATHTVVYVIVVGGLSAGLFEETARLVGAKLLKQHRTYKDMISFGLGHGLCEVILLVGLGQVNNLLFCMILQDPQLAASLGFSNDLLQAVNQQLAAASPAMVYLGILERVSAVMYHVFATCLVFLAVKPPGAVSGGHSGPHRVQRRGFPCADGPFLSGEQHRGVGAHRAGAAGRGPCLHRLHPRAAKPV